MVLSIIISSFKRADLLRIGLTSIAAQNINQPFEIIVVNDGIPDHTEAVCKEFPNLNIKYFFSGQRNIPTLQWRCPSFALNIGVKKAAGEFILLTSPEIYYLTPNCLNTMLELSLKNKRCLSIPQIGYDDMMGITTQKVIDGDEIFIEKEPVTSLNTELPFCLMMSKHEFKLIGGYDEEFTGYCYDDADLIRRLCQNGCGEYVCASGHKILHLFHGKRNDREGLTDRQKKLKQNMDLYNSKMNIIKRNKGENWGVL